MIRFVSATGRVEVRHGWTEMGQGMHTVALQVAVEELGLDPALVDVIVDTTRELGIGQTTGSRGALMGAGAVKAACEAARAAGCAPDVDHEGEYRVDWTQKMGEAENPDYPLDVRIRRAAGGYGPPDRGDRAGGRRP